MMLENLLGSKLRAKALGWLFTHPDERYFVRQLTNLLGEDSTNVSRELARLESTGILILTREGKQKYYQANKKSPIFNELHMLIMKTAGAADILRSALAPSVEKIKVAFIFGSLAGGKETRISDIDIMVIGGASFSEIISLVSPAQKTLGREINPVVYPVSEFKQKIRDEQNFLNRVFDSDKVFLVGDGSDLARLVGKRTSKSA